jgi:hypothetical protein
MRQGLLDQFPGDVPITVLAFGTDFYERAATRRAGLTLLPLAADAALPAIGGSVIVDGLDLLADPASALRELRRASVTSRVFALVSNAACGTTLLNFLAGGTLAAARPMVASEIDELFAQSGWHVVTRSELIDRSIAHGPIPYPVSNRGVTVTVTSPEIAERLSTAGFVVVADPK